MQLFGIGPLELLFILVLMVLVLGPRGMLRAAREAGKWIRKLTRSPLWAEIVGTSREVRDLPARIIKEAGIEEEMEELRRSAKPPVFPQDDFFLHPQENQPARELKVEKASNPAAQKKSTRENPGVAARTSRTSKTSRKTT
jgi:Sec-independent protein translocase protein TatA